METTLIKPSRITTERDVICTVHIPRQPDWPSSIDQAYVAHWFPIDDCLNPQAYGVRVCLWHRKPDFGNISMGESHYDFTVFEYDNQSDGYLLFKKRTIKTVGKKWANTAAEYYNLMD